MEIYPLKFRSLYKEKIWGGNNLSKTFNLNLKSDKIGESWEIAARENGTSIVTNGPLAGLNLQELISYYPQKIMGKTGMKYNKFPLLVKFLDAADRLSIQVHPDDEYATRVEGESGKTEMWYIIDAQPDARLIYGLKPGTTKKGFKRAIQNGEMESLLNRIPVKPGDTFFIPAGTLHGLEKGILLAEIQQNSDTTYRVYDWNRTGQNGKSRPLHIKKALEVIDFKQTYPGNNHPEYKNSNYTRSFLAACRYFAAEKISTNNYYTIKPEAETFYILLNIKGRGRLTWNNQNYPVEPGQSFLLPASLGRVKISGKLEIIVSYLPQARDIFIKKLTKLGIPEDDIKKIPGISGW